MDTILIIDDDKDLCNIMEECVAQEGYHSTTLHSYSEVSDYFRKTQQNILLIILDIMLPDGSGLNLLSEVRRSHQTPVIMVTAKDALEDKVIGLRLGADDYITKPFSVQELSARVSANIRRSQLNQNSRNELPLLFHHLQISLASRTVICNKKQVDFTVKEFDLLYTLASTQGTVFTKQQLYERVWKHEYLLDDNVLMAIISKIRRKLSIAEPEIQYIETIRGLGYRFNREV